MPERSSQRYLALLVLGRLLATDAEMYGTSVRVEIRGLPEARLAPLARLLGCDDQIVPGQRLVLEPAAGVAVALSTEEARP